MEQNSISRPSVKLDKHFNMTYASLQADQHISPGHEFLLGPTPSPAILQERLAPSAVTHRISTLHPYNILPFLWEAGEGIVSMAVRRPCDGSHEP